LLKAAFAPNRTVLASSFAARFPSEVSPVFAALRTLTFRTALSVPIIEAVELWPLRSQTRLARWTFASFAIGPLRRTRVGAIVRALCLAAWTAFGTSLIVAARTTLDTSLILAAGPTLRPALGSPRWPGAAAKVALLRAPVAYGGFVLAGRTEASGVLGLSTRSLLVPWAIESALGCGFGRPAEWPALSLVTSSLARPESLSTTPAFIAVALTSTLNRTLACCGLALGQIPRADLARFRDVLLNP
jgi:hypothetical protein